MKGMKNTETESAQEPAKRRRPVSRPERTGIRTASSKTVPIETGQEWKAIFQAIGHVTLILDPRHTILAANKAGVKAIGLSEQQLIGQKCHHVMHGSGRHAAGCPMKKMIASGHFETVEMEMETLGGIYVVSCVPVLDEAGQLKHIIHIATDITERREADESLRESEERYRLLFTHASEGILTLDMKGVVQDVNPRFLEMCGYSRDEIVGKNPLALAKVFRVNAKQVLARFGEFVSGQAGERDWTITARSGVNIDVRVLASFIKKDRKNIGISTIITDITTEKRMERLSLIQRDLGMALSTETDLNKALRLCVEAAIQASGMDCGGVYLAEPATGELVLAESMGLSRAFIKTVSHYESRSPNTKLVMSGTPTYTSYGKLRILKDDIANKEDLKAIAVIPIQHDGRVIACLNVSSHRTADVPDFSRSALEAIAAQIGGVIARRKSEDDLQRERDILARIAETSPAGIIMVNRDGHITYANAMAEQVLGLSKGSILQRTYDDPAWHITDYEGNAFPLEQLPFSRVTKTGQPVFDVRHAIEWPDGNRILLSINASPLFRSSGEVDGMIAIVEDVTNRVHTEAALQKSEERYRLVSENIPVAVYSALPNTHSTNLFLTGRMEELTGYPLQAFYDDHTLWKHVLHPEDRERVWQKLEEHRQKRTLLDVEYRIITKNGQVKWIRDKATPVVDAGRLVRIDGFMEDITGRKQTEEALRESEERFRSIFENVSIGLYRTTPDGSILMANQVLIRMLGYESFTQLARRNLEKVGFEPEYPRSLFKKRIEEDGQIIGIESNWKRKDGSVLCVRENARAVYDASGKIIYYEGSVEDVTDRKNFEKTIEQAKREWEGTFDAMSDWVSMIDLDGRVVRSNKAGEKIAGMPLEKILGQKCWKLIHGTDEPIAGCPFLKMRETKQRANIEIEDPLNSRWLMIAVDPVFDVRRNVVGGVHTVRDITERRRAEDDLAESEEKYRAILDQSADSIYLMDVESRCVLEANRALQTLLGYSLEEMRGMTAYEFIAHPSDDVDEKIRMVMERGQIFAGERVYRRRDGTLVHVEVNASCIQYRNKKVVCVVSRDIAERKQAESALRESRASIQAMSQLLETILDAIPDVIGVQNERHEIIRYNQAGYEFLNLKPEQVLGRKCFELIGREYPCEHCATSEVYRTRRPARIEKYEPSMNIWLDCRAYPILDENGHIVRIIEHLRDITESKKADEALRESEERYRNLVEFNPAAIAVHSEGKLVYINQACCQVMGASNAEQIVGMPVIDFVHPDYRGIVASRIKQTQVDKGYAEPIEEKFVRLDGKTVDVEVTAIPTIFQGKTATQVVFSDITERRRAERELERSHSLLEATVESTADGLLAVDRQGRILRFNRRFAEMWCIPADILAAQNDNQALDFVLNQLMRPDTFIGKVRELYAQPDAESFDILNFKDGRVFERFSQPQRIGEEIVGRVWSFRDITERKRAEETLQESEAKYRNLIDQSHDAIYLLYDRSFEVVNRRFVELFGYTQEETNAPDFNFMDVVAPRSRGLVRERTEKVDRGEAVSPQYEFAVITKDGREIEVETSVSYVPYKGGMATQGILRDITERKRLQLQLLQAEKMSALGQLISGVAHELNNPMSGVLGFSQLLLMSENIPEKEKKSLEKINLEAERARKIVQNLLAFARQSRPEKRRVQINDVVNRSLELRAYEMHVSNIEVIRNLSPDIPHVLGDEFQLQQVFMNVIINAEQAILEAHRQGRFKVWTRYDPQRMLVGISFQDDGPGIPQEHLARIFDPFYTTKPVGKGTGLGLSVAYGIIQGHGGQLIVQSEVGKGATFIIELPVAPDGEEWKPLSGEPVGQPSPIGNKRILVVDDEDSVVDLVRATLERQGHTVEVAFDGLAACEKILESSFDAVVCDLKMPRRDGVDVYHFCQERRPDLTRRFLFLTGDINATDSLLFMKEQDIPYVPKPFDLKSLTEAVSQLFFRSA